MSSSAIFSVIFPGTARVNSLLATAYISLFPNLLLAFVPPDINPASLNTLVSFAVGGLLGDVFLHLLPHSFLGEHQEANVTVVVDERKNVLVGLGIFFGLMFFFLMDKGMRVINGGADGHGHSHSHSHEHSHEKEKKHDHDHHDKKSSSKAAKGAKDDGLRNRKPTASTETDTVTALTQPTQPYQAASDEIKLSAYLNLFADATHNFTDGLAIAASFYSSPSIGATTFVAVFFHEIPHEVGDYAILIQSGFSKPRAMLAQFVTAVGAFLGTLAGIAIEEASRSMAAASPDSVSGLLGTDLTMADLVIPVTAGGFLYIATVGVIPELLEITRDFKKDMGQFVREIFAMLVGVGMMTIIAWGEATSKQ